MSLYLFYGVKIPFMWDFQFLAFTLLLPQNKSKHCQYDQQC